MNYWLLTTEYPPFFGGGISTYCYHTARMLCAKGHVVSVFVNDVTVSDIRVETHENIRIIRFNPSRTRSTAFLGHVTNISYEFAHVVRYFIEKEGRPAIIESQEYLGIAYYLLQYRYMKYEWCQDIHIIITAHSPSFLYLLYNHVPTFRYPNFWIGEMEKFCLHAADTVISPSWFLTNELHKKFNVRNVRTEVVPNPYKTGNKVSNSSFSAGSGDEIVFFGKLSAQKGTFKLLEYFSSLWTSGKGYKLRMIGAQDIVYHPEGKTMGDIVRKKYRPFIEEKKLLLQQKIPPSQIEPSLSKARLVVIPSTVDNLPYVVLEMMALGKIVLVSKQGGQAEIINDGVDGFIFDHDQPDTFFKQLERIFQLTDEERGKISSHAIEKIATEYRYEHIYDKKIKVINSLLANPAKADNFPFRQSGILSDQSNKKTGKGLLSIVLTFYNSGVYIDDAIQCLSRVDYPDKEIIIVDDGSDDLLSIQKLDRYRNYPGVRVITKKNKGLADTRNVGAEEAQGEFLAFLDADDRVSPSYYSRAINVLRCYANVHFAGCWTKYFGGSDSTWPTFNPEPPLILFHNTINSAALVYKKDSFLIAGKNDECMPIRGLEDYESVVAMLVQGYNGITLPEVLFHYHVRPDSMVRGISSTKKLLVWQYMAHKHRKIYESYGPELASLLNSNGPGIKLDNPSLDLDIADVLPFRSKLTLKVVGMLKRNRHAKKIAYKIYRLFKK